MKLRAHDLAIGLLEPVRALCDPRLYAGASSRSSWRAVGYVAYLAAISAVLAGVWMRLSVIPNVDDLITWIAPRMPALEFTANGTKTEVIQPYLVSAGPRGPTMLCVDTEGPRGDACGEANFLVTKNRIVIGATGTPVGPWTYELARITDGDRRMFQYLFGDGPGLRGLYLRFRSWSVVAVALLVGVVVFIWKVSVALGVGVAVLLIGRVVGARLRWASVLNVTAWAVTPAAVLQGLALEGLVPPSMFRLTASVAVTGAWVVAGMVAALLQAAPPHPSPVIVGESSH